MKSLAITFSLIIAISLIALASFAATVLPVSVAHAAAISSSNEVVMVVDAAMIVAPNGYVKVATAAAKKDVKKTVAAQPKAVKTVWGCESRTMYNAASNDHVLVCGWR